MKVTLTIEASNGQLSHVEAEAETYQDAKAAAEALVSEGSRAIAIRTS
ncbi:hypothetical protein [Paenarthrobacter ilicis]|uniref:Uncharacterized protein n=1 Tax=Paenarthrobacter ilicis TaxID=43665 RepID=A0ABX0TGP2_9MICC|nr:hypothetical protein [Paenarthrobacter ilicis]MBM7791681.1 hypothetical protein [Paenarthrobacter ilicis]NIJ01693.1 hypothetical protein [Paenarthrobacter ilicis]